MANERPRRRSARRGTVLTYAAGLLVAGCSPGPATHDTAVQTWRDLQVHVESRSGGIGSPMQELLVYVNRGPLPAWDCRVDVRTSDADPWKQAVEDGRVAVYRRAARVDAGEHAVAQVRIRAESDEVVLRFPLPP